MNVLDALMEDIIMSNLNHTMIVKINKNTRVLRYTHILEKSTNLKKLRSSVSISAIFGFDTRASNNSLLFTPLRNKSHPVKRESQW